MEPHLLPATWYHRSLFRCVMQNGLFLHPDRPDYLHTPWEQALRKDGSFLPTNRATVLKPVIIFLFLLLSPIRFFLGFFNYYYSIFDIKYYTSVFLLILPKVLFLFPLFLINSIWVFVQKLPVLQSYCEKKLLPASGKWAEAHLLHSLNTPFQPLLTKILG